MKTFLLILWQFPQWLLGWILIGCLKAKRQACVIDGKEITWWKFEREGRFSSFISGAALVNILLHDDNCDEITIRHEWGHCKQSEYLGPLYLLVIGLFSGGLNLWSRWFRMGLSPEEQSKLYYCFWTEAWADRLGGVKRGG